MLLRVFVYGTLKRGERNFDAHCHNAITIRPAWVRGRLLMRHTHTPILSLPPQSILALGTHNPLADLQLQQQNHTIPTAPADPHWVRVHGEIMEFADIEAAIARLDKLEQFHPDANDNLYDRVLIPLEEGPQTAWTYAIPRHRTEDYYAPAPDPTNWTKQWLTSSN